ncbi:hypothetical protein ABB55_15400 [Prosthecomicrobium hirschii]|uniref:VWFA domain-containing protein n=1 Tax=Prosthecodimorpha hirschii TaxID=665126 RepID=A0A0P6VQF9_9HYPH|nr:magnesium chelatase subunit D [Prosthecomicrobium hirschii]KPL53432.1 hypothetical protein ABB55_15400 [Prosthecomicrobium hirschii]
MTAPDRTQQAFADASRAADLIAVDPVGLGGLILGGGRGATDPIVERLVAQLGPGIALRRLPASIDPGRLDGGLDVAATLAAGRPVDRPGLLAEAAGALLVVPSAERLGTATAGRLAAALDRSDTVPPAAARRPLQTLPPIVVALDEGGPDDPPLPGALTDRLAFRIDLSAVRLADLVPEDEPDIEAARARLGAVDLPDPLLHALAEAAIALGVGSPRALILAARTMRASAALAGRSVPADEDVVAAAHLVLAPRATRWPMQEPEAAEPPPPPAEAPDDAAETDTDPSDRPLADRVIEATAALLPPDLLARLATARSAPRSAADGRSGPDRRTPRGAGGRPLPSRPGRPTGGARLDLLETLRRAAPMKRLRAAPPPGMIVAVRPADLAIRRHRRHARSTTVFVVDASGSSALHRLAEAKGAVEIILSDCYVRRDRVALLIFRGRVCETVLPPTGSLTQARRRLADMAAGGGTPLAAAIEAGLALALRLGRADEAPNLVFLTDGQGNVALDGAGGRGRAEADALAAAARLRVHAVPTLMLDISDRPNPRAGRLAEAMGATYLPLPRADAGVVAAAVRSRVPARRAG